MTFDGKRKSIENPHHIIPMMEAGEVVELRAIDSRNVVLEKFSPIVTMDHIKSRLKNNHGPGRYQVVGMDLNNKRHLGYRLVEINPYDRRESLGGGWYRQHRTVPEAVAARTDHALALKDQNRLEDREQRLDDRQAELEARNRELEAAQQVKREEFHEERLDHMSKFFQLQREADREMKLEIEKMRIAAETDRIRIEAGFREREVDLKEEMQQAAMMSYQSTQTHSDDQSGIRRMEMELSEQRHSLEIEKLRLETQLEMQKLKANRVPIPAALEKLYWQRKINEEMPERTLLDQIAEYAEPVIEIINKTPGGIAALLKILTGAGTITSGLPAPVVEKEDSATVTAAESAPDWPSFDSEDDRPQYGDDDEAKLL